MRVLAIGAGVDVGAARDQQSIDQIESFARTLDKARVRWDQQGESPGAVNLIDVVARQQQRGLVPHAPARLLERGADADHGSSHDNTIGSTLPEGRHIACGPH